MTRVYYPGYGGIFHEQGSTNAQRTEQTGLLGGANLGVPQQRPECKKAWCRENGVCEQTYYKWQKRLFEMAQAQQEVQFAEVTPLQPVRSSNVAITVRISGIEADIHSGADAATVEMVLQILKSC